MDKHSKGIWKVAKNAFPWVVLHLSKAWAKRVYLICLKKKHIVNLSMKYSKLRVDGNDPITNWEQHVNL